MFLVICSYFSIPFTRMPPFFVASSTSCLLVITDYGWFYTPSYPYCWWLPSNNETRQWKIHRLVRWFSQLEHHLHRTFNCHVWLPECISLLNPDGNMYTCISILKKIEVRKIPGRIFVILWTSSFFGWVGDQIPMFVGEAPKLLAGKSPIKMEMGKSSN
jgi:hypothetical protein